MVKDFLTAKLTRKKMENFVARYRCDDKLVLDLGCGDGNYRQYFKNRIGLDNRAGEYVDVVADACRLPFEANKFDLILCTELLEHLPDHVAAIKEMNRVLKPEGLLLLTTRFIFPLHDTPHDYFRFTKYGLKYLFREQWEILDLTAETSTKETLAILLQRIGFQTKLYGGAMSKFFLFAIVKLFFLMPLMIQDEFGDIRHHKKEDDILTSGYYLVAKKL